MFVVVGGFISSAISDHVSRKVIIQIGVVGMTFFTLLIPLVQTGEQLIIVRLLTGIGLGFAITAPFPVAAELMPAQHRRTFGAIYEICLASAFALLPFVGALSSQRTERLPLIALPGGLALFVVPVLVHFVIPESPRWLLRRGQTQAAIDTVNQYIRRCGNRVAPLTVADLGPNLPRRAKVAAVRRLVRARTVPLDRGRHRDRICAGSAYYLIAILLPKALIDQGAAVWMASASPRSCSWRRSPARRSPPSLWSMGRRWTIAYAISGAFPGLLLMAGATWQGVTRT